MSTPQPGQSRDRTRPEPPSLPLPAPAPAPLEGDPRGRKRRREEDYIIYYPVRRGARPSRLRPGTEEGSGSSEEEVDLDLAALAAQEEAAALPLLEVDGQYEVGGARKHKEKGEAARRAKASKKEKKERRREARQALTRGGEGGGEEVVKKKDEETKDLPLAQTRPKRAREAPPPPLPAPQVVVNVPPAASAPPTYEVERILARRVDGQGRAQFKIKWLGFDNRFNSWIDAADMDAPDKLEEWTRTGGKEQPPTKPRPKPHPLPLVPESLTAEGVAALAAHLSRAEARWVRGGRVKAILGMTRQPSAPAFTPSSGELLLRVEWQGRARPSWLRASFLAEQDPQALIAYYQTKLRLS